MAVRNHTTFTSWLTELGLNDEDKLSFTFYYLVNINIISRPVGNFHFDTNYMISLIETQFKDKFPDEKSRLMQAKHIGELYRSYQIQTEQLDWIDEKNPRQCYYIWCLLRLISGYMRTISSPLDLLNIQTDKLAFLEVRDYEQLNLSLTPSSAAECKSTIIKFFRRWNQTNAFKIELIECLKRNWNTQNEFKHKIFSHLLHDNHEHGQWFWNYLIDKAKVPHWFLIPTTDSEYFACAFAILYIWQVSHAEKTLMLNKAYSSFHNSRSKQKPDNEKGANLWLNADSLNQLNEIARKKNCSTKLALKRLIAAEFDKISK